MAHYKVEESSLTMVADAIRERSGTSDLTFMGWSTEVRK